MHDFKNSRGQVMKKNVVSVFLPEVTISSNVTYWADCVSNISHDERKLFWCQPPNTNIDDAEDATAGAKRGACIGAAAAASPVSKLTTSTLVQPDGINCAPIASDPPIM